MNEKINTISKEKLEEGRKINTLPDEKKFGEPNGSGKPGIVKNLRGVWTYDQIAENPIEYLEYLESLLKNEQHADKIRDIISKIEKVKEEYFSDEYSKRRNR